MSVVDNIRRHSIVGSATNKMRFDSVSATTIRLKE